MQHRGSIQALERNKNACVYLGLDYLIFEFLFLFPLPSSLSAFPFPFKDSLSMSLYRNDPEFHFSGWGKMGGGVAGALDAPTGILDASSVLLGPTAL